MRERATERRRRSEAEPRTHLIYSETHSLTGRDTENGDAMFFEDKKNLIFLFDGMGRTASRVRAAETAVTIMSGQSFEEPDSESLFRTSFQRVHDGLNELEERAQLSAVGFQIQGSGDELFAHIANIGKTRAYIFRGGQLRQLTKDDSPKIVEQHEAQVQDSLDTITSKEELREFKDTQFGFLGGRHFWERRNITGSGLGGVFLPRPILTTERIQSGDRILLASSGLRNLTTKEIRGILAQTAVDPATQLVDHAYRASVDDNRVRAHRDDISAIVIDVDQGHELLPARREYDLTVQPQEILYNAIPFTLQLADGTAFEIGRPEHMGFAKVPEDLYLAVNRERNAEDSKEGFFWIQSSGERFLTQNPDSRWFVSNFLGRLGRSNAIRIHREGDAFTLQTLGNYAGAKVIVQEPS